MSKENETALSQLAAHLGAPLPKAAYALDDSRGFPLTGLKAAYITERLNEVFGLCGIGWRFLVIGGDIAEGWALASVELEYRFEGEWSAPIFAYGDQRIIKGRVGDAKKGAVTDALKKAASFLGVGALAYKGLIKLAKPPKPSKPPPTKKAEHWLKAPGVRKKFWAWTKGYLGLSEDEVHQVLGVKSMYQYKGTNKQAFAALKKYAVEMKISVPGKGSAEQKEEENDA